MLIKRGRKHRSSGLLIFFRRLIWFLLLLFLGISMLFVFARYLSNSNSLIGVDITLIACGDSHIVAGINDTVLPSSINIALTSQPYFYTYSVLKLLLPNNPHIETVLLGYSFHSLCPTIDKLLYDRKLALRACLNRTPFLPISPVSYVYKLVIADGLQELCTGSIKQIHRGLFLEEIAEMPFIGGYYSSNGNNLNDENVDASIQRHYYDEYGVVCSGNAYIQIEYLNKIIELCNQNNVELYLLNTPISLRYYEAIPRNYIDNYYNIASAVDATLLDFHDFPLPDSCYGDADHLNFYGATQFSLFLDSLLNQ